MGLGQVIQWSVVVTLATVASYASIMISVPALTAGGTKSGISFISVFFVRFLLGALLFLPLFGLVACAWPKFREDVKFRATGSRGKLILASLGIGLVAQLLFARAFSMGLDADATRHRNAIMIILIPIFYKCFSKKHNKRFNVQLGIGLILLAIGSALIIDDDFRNH